MANYRRIVHDGLWQDNVVFTQLLALCPLLAVTSGATNGLGLGLATTVVMATSGLAISLLRGVITEEVRIAVFILVIAALVTLVDMIMNAWLHELHKVLGLFIPLIVTHCAILGRAETFASRQPATPALVDGFAMGVGFTLALVVGATRELLGSGTLFANASVLLGETFSFLELVVIPDYGGFLPMILPPGGFLAVGFLLAAKRLVDRRLRAPVPPAAPARGVPGRAVA